MSDIIFARTRWNYDSYVDYWKLVELSGFPIFWLDDMDLSRPNTTYIVSPMNGEFVPYMEHNMDRSSKVVLWNLERPGDDGIQGYTDGNRKYMDDGLLDEVIVSDRQLARDTGFKYVPLGSHHKLGAPGGLSARLNGYDLIHLCCYSPHRSYLFTTPSTNKSELYGLRVASNGWGGHRRIRLMSSRFMLNIHQDAYPYMEPLRFSLAAAYGLPILSEHCVDTYPYEQGWVTLDTDMDRLLNSDWVTDTDIFADKGFLAGILMREAMTTDFSFRNCLERFL